MSPDPEAPSLEQASYHMRQAKEIWASMDPLHPVEVQVRSVDWHLACAAVYVRIAEVESRG